MNFLLVPLIHLQIGMTFEYFNILICNVQIPIVLASLIGLLKCYLGQATDVCSPPKRKGKHQIKTLTANANLLVSTDHTSIPGVELKQRSESNMSGQLFGVASRVGRSRQFSSSKISWLGKTKFYTFYSNFLFLTCRAYKTGWSCHECS